MPIRVAVVGPGRVGSALGRRFVDAGATLVGFVGRRPESVRAALQFCAAGRALALDDLAGAHVVVFAVGDPDLPQAVVGAAAATAPRRCSLWLHTSGRHGLDVLSPLQGRGVRLGALHPVAPFPDAAAGLHNLAGRPAVLLGGADAMRLLRRLAGMLGMRALEGRDGDRVLYHAACALAANGLTALCSAVDDVLAASGALLPADAVVLARELMAAALAACTARGPEAALSGPVARGDDATVALHRRALHGQAAHLDLVYRALMEAAVRLAERRGLAPSAVSALRRALSAAMP